MSVFLFPSWFQVQVVIAFTVEVTGESLGGTGTETGKNTLFLMSLSSDKYFLVGGSGTQVSPEAGGYSRTRSLTKEDRSGKYIERINR